jgi:transcriptional regulator
MAKTTASTDELLDEAVRLLKCLTARDMARAGVTQQAIAKFLKTAKADIGPMVRGIRKVANANE